MQAVRQRRWEKLDDWLEILLGYEGSAARIYWNALVGSGLMTSTFKTREGRGTGELGNQMLNYGYAMLNSMVWSAIENAGLEPYYGLLHQTKPGKPALVLDLMEVYRPWVVDRNVIKLRRKANDSKGFTSALKNQLATTIQSTFAGKYTWRKKRLRLDTIIQRQAYQLAGAMADSKKFRAYHFKW